MFNLLIDFNKNVHNAVHELEVSESNDHKTIQSIMVKAEENNQNIKKIIETNTRQVEKVSENIEQDLAKILEFTERFRAGSTPQPAKKNKKNQVSSRRDPQMESAPPMREVSQVSSVGPKKEESSVLLEITGNLIESNADRLLKSVENIDSHIDTLLNKTGEKVEKRVDSFVDKCEKKLENLDSHVDAFFKMSDEEIEDKVDSFLDDLEKKFEKQCKKSEDEIVDQLEKALDATTGAERMALSKEIKERYGQSTLSKILLRMGKGGYELGRKMGVLKRNEYFEAGMELAEEVNEARQTVLDEVTSLIEQPIKTVHKKIKKWINE